ncbi:hypothetical protein IWX49DRAFT_589192 [Phyllosticta citricarpa]|uniref:F-box domain-containing protein n=2 Tax=Phyllosticta TaxID=121621 RepID=A0ABR1M6S6_9PEZI
MWNYPAVAPPRRYWGRRPSHPYIWMLPDELLLRIVGFVEVTDQERAVVADLFNLSPFNSIASLSWTCRKFQQMCDETISRTVSLLKKPVWAIEDVAGHYARIAQGNPAVNDPRVLNFFWNPPVHRLKHTRNIAFHQFWHAFGCSPLEQTAALDMIARGMSIIIQAPNRLRRLHIDGELQLAQLLEQEFINNPASRAALASVEEIVLSIEFAFILQYTPRVSRVSNNTYLGRPTRNANGQMRTYTQAEVYRFLQLCSRLPRLRKMELTIDRFPGPDFIRRVNLPPMQLQSLAITRDIVLSCEDVSESEGRPILMGALLNMARSQPNLEELRIPEEEYVMFGAPGDWDGFDDDEQLGEILRAAVIAAKVPHLKRILVDQSVTIEVFWDDENRKCLRYMSEDMDPNDRRHNRYVCANDPNRTQKYPQTFGQDLWIQDWDAWKEPLIENRRRLKKQDTCWDELPLVVGRYYDADYPAWIEYNEHYEPLAVVANIADRRIEVADEDDA